MAAPKETSAAIMTPSDSAHTKKRRKDKKDADAKRAGISKSPPHERSKAKREKRSKLIKTLATTRETLTRKATALSAGATDGCFQRLTVDTLVTLAPKYIGRVEKGVHEHLSQMLMRYTPELDAVVLMYSDVEITSSTAAILYDSPYFHVPVRAQLYVLRARPGAIVSATANIASAQHIGFLVYGIFNVSVQAADLGAGWQWRDSEQHWERVSASGARTVLAVGATAQLELTEVVSLGETVAMRGRLVGH